MVGQCKDRGYARHEARRHRARAMSREPGVLAPGAPGRAAQGERRAANAPRPFHDVCCGSARTAVGT